MKPRAELNDLVDVWWKTAEAMEATPALASKERQEWHARVFEKILDQCGWTTTEWNDAVVPKEEENKA